MPKKKRYFPRRRNTGNDEQRTAEADARIQRAAQDLANNRSVDELKSMLLQSQQAFDEADRRSMDDPGPVALERYRYASRVLAEVERALELASARST